MKITIREDEEKEFRIRVPLSLISTKLASHMIVKERRKELSSGKENLVHPDSYLTGDAKNITRFLKVVKKFAKENPGWPLVEVESDNGEYIKVEL